MAIYCASSRLLVRAATATTWDIQPTAHSGSTCRLSIGLAPAAARPSPTYVRQRMAVSLRVGASVAGPWTSVARDSVPRNHLAATADRPQIVAVVGSAGGALDPNIRSLLTVH